MVVTPKSSQPNAFTNPPEPSHTAVGRHFADLVVMLSAVYRTPIAKSTTKAFALITANSTVEYKCNI